MNGSDEADDDGFYYNNGEDEDLTEEEVVAFTQQFACTQGFVFGELDEEAEEDELSQHQHQHHDDAEEDGWKEALQPEDHRNTARLDLLSQDYLSQQQEQDEEEQQHQLQGGRTEETAAARVSSQESSEYYPNSKRPRTEELPKDSDDRVFLDVDGEYRLFKKGESFHYYPPDSLMKKMTGREIYTIQSFRFVGGNKVADCIVSIPIRDTILGRGLAQEQRIQQSDLKTKYVRIRFTQTARLRYLNDRCEQPFTQLTYDQSPKDRKGAGWYAAFEFGDCIKRPILLFDSKPTAIDLFAGCGGMSTGLSQAGFLVKACVENDWSVTGTLIANHGESEVFVEDVNLFLDRVESNDSCYPDKKQIRHVHASPPCQGFSDANIYGGKNDTRNNESCFAFLRAVEISDCDTASMENVTGMIKGEKNVEYVQKIVTGLIILNYQVRVASKYETRSFDVNGTLRFLLSLTIRSVNTVVDSSRYGDPQKRLRVFILAAKKEFVLPDFPKPTHGAGTPLVLKTAQMALQDLECIPPREGEGRVQLPNGTVTTNHTRNNTKYAESVRLEADEQAPTVTTSNNLEHYSLPRGLTIREYARLQSFPDPSRFIGSQKSCRKQIGNAVPIGLATAIGKTVMESYLVQDDFFEDDDETLPSTEMPNNHHHPSHPRRVTMGRHQQSKEQRR